MDLLQIIHGCKNNDRRAQEALYHRMHKVMMPSIMKATHSNSHDVAGEIFNDGMMRVYKGIKQYEYKGSFEGWCRRILIYAIYNHLADNKKYRERTIFYEDYKVRAENNDEDYFQEYIADKMSGITEMMVATDMSEMTLSENMMLEQIFKTIVDNAPKGIGAARMVEIFKKQTMDGYTHRELAKEFTISLGTSKWYLNQAREILAKKYTRVHFVN